MNVKRTFCFIYCRWLYWVDDSIIFWSRLNGTHRSIFMNGSKPLALTIDFVSNILYWTDYDTGICESTLDGLSKRTIFFNHLFSPFKVQIVRNYILATSQIKNAYVLINRDDLSFAFINTTSNTNYYGISIISSLKKPSIGK